MIGEILYEGKGIMTINRIIQGGDGVSAPKIEFTMTGEGFCKGIAVGEIWTIIATISNDGTNAFGDGQGLIFTKDKINREIVVANAHGIGTSNNVDDTNPNCDKSTSQWVAFYRAKNPSARGTLNFLNNVVGMNRIETDDKTLKYTSNVRQWKLPPSTTLATH